MFPERKSNSGHGQKLTFPAVCRMDSARMFLGPQVGTEERFPTQGTVTRALFPVLYQAHRRLCSHIAEFLVLVLSPNLGNSASSWHHHIKTSPPFGSRT